MLHGGKPVMLPSDSKRCQAKVQPRRAACVAADSKSSWLLMNLLPGSLLKILHCKVFFFLAGGLQGVQALRLIALSSSLGPPFITYQPSEGKYLAPLLKQTTWDVAASLLLRSVIFMRSRFSFAWFPPSATRGHSMGLRVFVLPHNGSILPQRQWLPRLLHIRHHCYEKGAWGRGMGVKHGCICVWSWGRLLLKSCWNMSWSLV